MDLYQLRCFVTAAEELHFGRAARKLEILPSIFGRNVRLLEEDLGTKLFLRTTRSVVVSEDGEQLLRDARKLLALADAVRAGDGAGAGADAVCGVAGRGGAGQPEGGGRREAGGVTA